MDFPICTIPLWRLCCMSMTAWHVCIWKRLGWAGCFHGQICRAQKWAANTASMGPYSLMGETKRLSACTSMMNAQLACGRLSLTELPALRTSHALKKKLDSICWFFCTLMSCSHIQHSALCKSLIKDFRQDAIDLSCVVCAGFNSSQVASALTE